MQNRKNSYYVVYIYIYISLSNFEILEMRRRIKYANYDVHYMKRMYLCVTRHLPRNDSVFVNATV